MTVIHFSLSTRPGEREAACGERRASRYSDDYRNVTCKWCHMSDPTRAAEIARLCEAIRASGLSITEYARRVLVRDSRTLRRWLAGDRQIPQAVLELIETPADECATCGRADCPGERTAF